MAFTASQGGNPAEPFSRSGQSRGRWLTDMSDHAATARSASAWMEETRMSRRLPSNTLSKSPVASIAYSVVFPRPPSMARAVSTDTRTGSNADMTGSFHGDNFAPRADLPGASRHKDTSERHRRRSRNHGQFEGAMDCQRSTAIGRLSPRLKARLRVAVGNSTQHDGGVVSDTRALPNRQVAAACQAGVGYR
jgi:hypothetical protein